MQTEDHISVPWHSRAHKVKGYTSRHSAEWISLLRQYEELFLRAEGRQIASEYNIRVIYSILSCSIFFHFYFYSFFIFLAWERGWNVQRLYNINRGERRSTSSLTTRRIEWFVSKIWTLAEIDVHVLKNSSQIIQRENIRGISILSNECEKNPDSIHVRLTFLCPLRFSFLLVKRTKQNSDIPQLSRSYSSDADDKTLKHPSRYQRWIFVQPMQITFSYHSTSPVNPWNEKIQQDIDPMNKPFHNKSEEQ